MRRPRYEVIEHPSDVGFELSSTSRADLFADAVLVYYDMLVGLDGIDAREPLELAVEGDDDEDLMVALLSQCVFNTEVERRIFSVADVASLDGFRLRLRLRGEPIDERRHRFELGIKAVTYHDLRVEEAADGTWRARVVFDI